MPLKASVKRQIVNYSGKIRVNEGEPRSHTVHTLTHMNYKSEQVPARFDTDHSHVLSIISDSGV